MSCNSVVGAGARWASYTSFFVPFSADIFRRALSWKGLCKASISFYSHRHPGTLVMVGKLAMFRTLLEVALWISWVIVNIDAYCISLSIGPLDLRWIFWLVGLIGLLDLLTLKTFCLVEPPDLCGSLGSLDHLTHVGYLDSLNILTIGPLGSY